MHGTTAEAPHALATRGDARFVGEDDLARLESPLGASRTIVATVAPLGVAERGRLREAIEAAIEGALERRGASPPGVGSSSDLDACLSDQLYRARSVGAPGVTLCIGTLEATASLAGALDADDSAVLRWWLAATVERPVVLLVDSRNRGIGAYGPPTRIEALVERRAEIDPSPVPPAYPALPASDRPPPQQMPRVQGALPFGAGGPALRVVSTSTEPEARCDDVPDAPETIYEDVLDEAEQRSTADDASDEDAGEASGGPLARADEIAPPSMASARSAARPALRAAVDWRAHASDLEAARGPKPLAAVERLFVSHYLPLAGAVARGEADAAAKSALAGFGSSFAKSYSEAFGALRVTGKRPMMVLDAPSLATRIARLHGAKTTHLVLVDSMRFDLGLRVHERVKAALGPLAACAERVLLWSALPTTTPAQLELLARGPEGLASYRAPAEREETIARGRTLSALRRVKVGPRDFYKLDVVEARLRDSGPPEPERLDAIAEEVALALASHARTLQPRTLMFVFGDHGFRLEGRDGGTAAASQGGASPEEVLVPAFAWIVGGLH